jgi:lipoprotein-anchoring transpeptidase ErfK/SrfK
MPLVSLLATAVLFGNILAGSAADDIQAAELSLPEIRIEVSLSDRQLRVLRGEELMRSYPVAIGQDRYPTPVGDFQIGRVIWNPRWVPPRSEWAKDETAKEPGDPGNPMGKAKIFFKEPDYYIHGTEEEESLGQAASHGCLRMANADVVDLARLVMEHGGEKRSPNWFRRIMNFVRSTEEVRLSDPIPLRIVG